VLVCIGVVDALETGVVDQTAPRGVREDAEEVVVVVVVLYRLSVVHPGCRRSRCIPETGRRESSALPLSCAYTRQAGEKTLDQATGSSLAAVRRLEIRVEV
jgi:hypothetical protein